MKSALKQKSGPLKDTNEEDKILPLREMNLKMYLKLICSYLVSLKVSLFSARVPPAGVVLKSVPPSYNDPLLFPS